MRKLAAAVALTLLLGACGSPGGGGGDAARDAVLAAATTTEDAGSARVSADISFTVPEGVEPGFSGFGMTIEGVMDLDGRRGQMTMSFEGLPETPGLEGFDDIEMIVDGTDVYMKSPILSPDDSKPWVRMDFSDMAGSGAQFSQTDPTQALQYLHGVSDDVEEVGSQQVRGVSTTHYRATVQLDTLLEEMPEKFREQSQAAFEKLDTDEFPMDIWIDDQGRLRRTFTEFDLSGVAEGAEGSKMAITFDFYDFGIEFDIELPPDDEVTDAPAGLFGTPTG